MNRKHALVEAARSAEKSGDLSAAFLSWKELCSESKRADHFCHLGRVSKGLGRWAEAESSCLDALSIEPNFPVAMLMLASLFLVRTDGDRLLGARKTILWADRALEIDRSAMALSLKGAAYNHLGERESAKEAYRQATELDDSYEEAFFNLGLLTAEDGDDAEAERLLRRAIEVDPGFLEAHGRLGILLRKLGKDAEADREFRRCLEINPTDHFAMWYLSRMSGDPPC